MADPDGNEFCVLTLDDTHQPAALKLRPRGPATRSLPQAHAAGTPHVGGHIRTCGFARRFYRLVLVPGRA